MAEDMYLSLAIELFEKGTWSKDVFIKRITLYAKEKNMDMSIVDEIIDRLTNTKEYTIEEKRKFLSFVTISGNELKYGDVAYEMSDEMVEKFYEMEKNSLDKAQVEALHNMKETKKVWDIENELFIPNFQSEIEKKHKDVFTWNKSIKDIIYGNYTAKDILGTNDSEKEERFRFLVENVKSEELRDVANSLVNKLDPSYCLNFTLEWEKFHNKKLDDTMKTDENVDVEVARTEEKEEIIVDETPLNLLEPVVEKLDNNEIIEEKKEKEDLILDDEENASKFVIPKLSFDSYGEDDLPTTEEEYEKQAENLTKQEKDSTVRKVNISPERLAKLKRTKDRAINCSLKTAMMILAYKLAGPIIGTATIVGYMYFAEEIKCGTFNPKNPVGKAVKYAVEKVMNIGIKKDKRNERGMSR